MWKKIKRILGDRRHVNNTMLCGDNHIGNHTALLDSVMGRMSYCGARCLFVETYIGSFCSIGNDVKVIAAVHPSHYASSHPFFYARQYTGTEKSSFDEYLYTQSADIENGRKFRAIIGDDVWIGDEVMIKGGVTIGTGAIVGSRALVTKDVPPYAIVGGVPAHIIRYRFDRQIISELLESKWWEMPYDHLCSLRKYVDQPQAFLSHANKLKG